jgi:hypothetical protein
MSDYISNSNQSRILEQLADQDDIMQLRNFPEYGAQEADETQESPSFCELVLQKQFDQFQYTHPNDTVDLKYSAAENFLSRGESLGVVFAMAIGHGSFSRLTTKKPFTETKQKKHTQVFKPPNSILAKEVIRRGHFLFHGEYEKAEDNPLYNKNSKQVRMPKPSGWSREDLMDFLEQKTIKLHEKDIAFIHSEIYLYGQFLTRELDSNKLKPDTTAWDNGSWEGIVPNVRLIEIALSDEFRMDFVHRNDGQSRQQLDARGTESQTVSFWEKVRRKFNDRTVMVTSCPLHANWGREIFLEIHDCNWKEMDALGIKPIPDETSCKLHYTSLNNKLGSIYKNWKASGNGDHQVAADTSLEEAEVGTLNLENLPTQGGDRIEFLGNYNICVMYLWFSLIKAGAFLYSQTEFPSAFQADDDYAPKITKGGRASLSVGSSSGASMSSKSSSTRNKKGAAVKEESEIEVFTRQIDRLNNSMLLDSRLDRLIAAKNRLTDQLKDLKIEIHSLIDKKYKADLEYETEQIEHLKAIKKKYRDLWQERYAEAEQLAKLKEKQIEEFESKEKIIEKKLYEIKDKTPKRSGNSSKHGNRRVVVPSSIYITDDTPEERRVAGLINFDTPAAATTPTASSTQVNNMLNDLNNKRKRSEEKEETRESLDLLAQETPKIFSAYNEEDDDDSDEELFKKVL